MGVTAVDLWANGMPAGIYMVMMMMNLLFVPFLYSVERGEQPVCSRHAFSSTASRWNIGRA